MNVEKRLPLSLFFLRISVFLVMFVWTLDKLIRPSHAAMLYENFYFLGGMSSSIMYFLAAIEMLIILGFLFGIKKRFTYGVVLLLHAISTFSSFPQYLSPYDGPNILFFAAWPMLAACFALYYLRDADTKFNCS